MLNRVILPLAIICTLTLGCVTAGDLRDLASIQEQSIEGIREAQAVYQEEIEEILADTTKTQDERLQGMEAAAAARNKAIEDLAKAAGTSVDQLLAMIVARTEAMVDGVGTLTGSSWLDFLMQILAGAGLGVVGTNQIRDRRRALRGEPVGPAVPLHTATTT